jgi:hypothetical protein
MAEVSMPFVPLNLAFCLFVALVQFVVRYFSDEGHIRNLRIIDGFPMLEGYSEKRGNMRVVPPPNRHRMGSYFQVGKDLPVSRESPFVPWALGSPHVL